LVYADASLQEDAEILVAATDEVLLNGVVEGEY
jgi:hypothetical protein